jgi:glycosyltransferase involved in cell wall biosynthesis
LLPREQVLGLIRACDAYVSLHRAEGFGLGMVEAMSFGRIVIGTDYSGCTDFLTAQTGYPVPYALRPVLPDEYPYAEGQSGPSPTSMPQLISCATSSPIPRNRAVARWLVDRSSGSATALRLLGG